MTRSGDAEPPGAALTQAGGPGAAADRPAGLGERAIVAAALGIIAEHGVRGLSMRLLSQRLGVALGATYRHVPNKHDLLRLVAAELYASVRPADGSDGDKFEQAKRVMIQVHDVLAAYPGMAAHIAQNVPEFTSARVASLITGPLRAAGLSQGEADRITFALVLLNAGHMLFHVPASLEDVAGMQAVLADTGLQVTEIEFLGGWALDGDPAELEELVRRIEAVADAFGGRHVSAGERPATSRTLAMNCGSVLSFQVPATCGFSPKARQIRETDDCDRPVSPAIVQVDQCVSCPGPFSVRTRVTTSSTCWSVIVRGARALGASVRPFIPPSMNRTRHLRADSRDTPVRSATAVSGATPR